MFKEVEKMRNQIGYAYIALTGCHRRVVVFRGHGIHMDKRRVSTFRHVIFGNWNSLHGSHSQLFCRWLGHIVNWSSLHVGMGSFGGVGWGCQGNLVSLADGIGHFQLF